MTPKLFTGCAAAVGSLLLAAVRAHARRQLVDGRRLRREAPAEPAARYAAAVDDHDEAGRAVGHARTQGRGVVAQGPRRLSRAGREGAGAAAAARRRRARRSQDAQSRAVRAARARGHRPPRTPSRGCWRSPTTRAAAGGAAGRQAQRRAVRGGQGRHLHPPSRREGDVARQRRDRHQPGGQPVGGYDDLRGADRAGEARRGRSGRARRSSVDREAGKPANKDAYKLAAACPRARSSSPTIRSKISSTRSRASSSRMCASRSPAAAAPSAASVAVYEMENGGKITMTRAQRRRCALGDGRGDRARATAKTAADAIKQARGRLGVPAAGLEVRADLQEAGRSDRGQEVRAMLDRRSSGQGDWRG